MVFSSPLFLFGFLPVVLLGYFALPTLGSRNAWLLAASLLFYGFGEAAYTLVLLASVGINWLAGLCIGDARTEGVRRAALAAAVTSNLALLGTFKYAHFAAENLVPVFSAFGLPAGPSAALHLPIGISFFTFQALSYVVDVYRGDAPVQRRLDRLALYIALFPQLVAGPIVRYRQIARRLSARSSSLAEVAAGAERFAIGLGKKVLLANTLAEPVDRLFALPAGELHASLAWFAVLGYALQIYFDFSGYSDMAIGLGRVFGFRFPENFRYPYVAGSIREFWRRWHISLSTWFRDYVYIPLGGSRGSAARTHGNLVLVFFLCGLWHGASWNFVIWGLAHGTLMLLERAGLERLLDRAGGALRHLYVMLALLGTWVLFRTEDLAAAASVFEAMLGLGHADASLRPLALYAAPPVQLALAVACVGCAPWHQALGHRVRVRLAAATGAEGGGAALECAAASLRLVGAQLLLVASAVSLLAGTHNPFIYFRF
jgi:alginate O-acetyltransferase complex protein AlgI